MKNSLNFGAPIKLRELTTSGEPTPVAKGGLFYNSDYNTYRIYDNAVWDNIISQSVFNAAVSDLQAGIIAAPSKLEWQNSVKSIVASLPGGPAVGDRYLLNDGAHINKIAEYFATGWVYSVPGVDFGSGTFVGVDAVAEGVYFWGYDVNQGNFAWVAKAWENPVFSDGLTLGGAAPGVLKVLAADKSIDVSSSGVKVNPKDASLLTDNVGIRVQLYNGLGLDAAYGVKVVANVDGTIVVDGSGVGVGTIGNGNITDNTISGAKLSESSVYGAKLVDNSVHQVKLNSDVWTYIQDSVVLYDDVTIGKNGSKQLYVKDCAITTARLADELDTATKAVKIKGTNGLFTSKLKLSVDGDYAKYAEEVYKEITLATGPVAELSTLGRAVVEYSIKVGSDYRVGTLYITPTSISDEFVEDADLGITWSILAGAVSVVGAGTMFCTVKTFLA